MSSKGVNTAQELAKLNANKESARHCLLAADRFLKDGEFQNARTELDKALKLDPSNGYIYAFQDRINYFEELKKKEPPAKPVAPVPPPKSAPGPGQVVGRTEKPSPSGPGATPKPVGAVPKKPEESPAREAELQQKAIEEQVVA